MADIILDIVDSTGSVIIQTFNTPDKDLPYDIIVSVIRDVLTYIKSVLIEDYMLVNIVIGDYIVYREEFEKIYFPTHQLVGMLNRMLSHEYPTY